MKKCTICKQEKPLDQFNKRARSSDGRQSACKECNAKHARKYYENNRVKHRATTNRQRKEKRKEVVNFIKEVKTKYGCQTCSESDVCCLDFHHLRDKIKEVALMIQAAVSKRTLVQEINKCVVLCANCHRKVHNGKIEVDESMLCDVQDDGKPWKCSVSLIGKLP